MVLECWNAPMLAEDSPFLVSGHKLLCGTESLTGPGRTQRVDLSQGECRCNYGAITLMISNETCRDIIEAGIEG